MPITYKEYYFRNKDYFDETYEIIMQLSNALGEVNKSKYYDGLRKYECKKSNKLCSSVDDYILLLLKRKAKLFENIEMYSCSGNLVKLDKLEGEMKESEIEIRGYFAALFKYLLDDDCVIDFVGEQYPLLFC